VLKVRHIIDAAESAGEQETVLQLGQRMKPKLIRAQKRGGGEAARVGTRIAALKLTSHRIETL